MPPITYSINDMPAFSAALGSFHVKSSSTSVVNSLTMVRGLPSTLIVTFLRSTILTVSCLGARWYIDHKYWSTQTSREAFIEGFGGGHRFLAVTWRFGESACELSDEDSALTNPLKSPCSTSSTLTVAI